MRRHLSEAEQDAIDDNNMSWCRSCRGWYETPHPHDGSVERDEA